VVEWWSPLIVVLYIPYIPYVLEHAISSSQLVWAFLFFTTLARVRSEGQKVRRSERRTNGKAHILYRGRSSASDVAVAENQVGECATTTITITHHSSLITITIIYARSVCGKEDRHGIPGNGNGTRPGIIHALSAASTPRLIHEAGEACELCVWCVFVWRLSVSSRLVSSRARHRHRL
jgi:hypothetical protein